MTMTTSATRHPKSVTDNATARHGSSRFPGAAAVLGAVLAAAAIDQLSKEWALRELADGHQVPLVPAVRLELFLNPGVAFGIGSHVGTPLVVALIAIVVALLVWLSIRVVRQAPLAGTLFLAVAAGGGIGNVLDRILRAGAEPLTGRVVDFIAVDWFAVFNVADIFTTCGIALWALTQLRTPARTPNRR
jgi:signal peptidase II